MYRKDSVTIKEWLKNSNKALLVTGARQTGKTWLIRDEIEKSSYKKFEINFIGEMYTEVVSGITGEVLTYVNSPEEENYFSDEFKLMYKGWQFERIEKSLG